VDVLRKNDMVQTELVTASDGSKRHRITAVIGPDGVCPREREYCIDNLLVRIHLIIEMILVDRPCAWEFEFPFPGRPDGIFPTP